MLCKHVVVWCIAGRAGLIETHRVAGRPSAVSTGSDELCISVGVKTQNPPVKRTCVVCSRNNLPEYRSAVQGVDPDFLG
jgi:hypothetical protein